MDDQREANYKIIRSQRCLVTNSLYVDVAHVKSRGSGGTDDLWNLMPLSREIHHIQHQIGILSFIRKYPSVAAYLASNGWYIFNGKLLNHNINTSE
jgi:hypothetical protein